MPVVLLVTPLVVVSKLAICASKLLNLTSFKDCKLYIQRPVCASVNWVLKYKLKIECGWDYTLIAPSVIKKFATDKGNANKELMLGAFQEDTGVNLEVLLDSSVKSPITDIADAYFICKYQEK